MSVPRIPAEATATAYVAACLTMRGACGLRSGVIARREPGRQVRVRNHPRKPMAIAKAAARTLMPIDTHGGASGSTEAQAPRAKMAKNGPPGRIRARSAMIDPTAAKNASMPMSPHTGVSIVASMTPMTTPERRSTAAWSWWMSRSWCGSPRPYMPQKAPKTA